MTVTCPCGTTFEAMRSDARFCSPKCRQKAYRGRGGVSSDVAPYDALERLREVADDLRGRADRAVTEGLTPAWERYYRALDQQVRDALGYANECLYSHFGDSARHNPQSFVGPQP